jgi:HD superfamily phosphohydrolase
MIKKLTVKDKVYGTYKIIEPVILELINTKSVQRLKYIRQQGLPKEWHYGVEFSRYEHSIGVYILLDKLNASLDEKIAGLLHDVSHMAFSHLYDYLIDNKAESYGDNIFFEFLNKDKELKKILKKYNYTLEDIVDFSNFSLLERDAPDLCADRVDYTLREYVAFKHETNLTNGLINDFVVVDNEIIFKTKKSAKVFYDLYKYFAENHWGGITHMIRYNIFVDVLKKALELKMIKYSDFFKTDDYIINIIKKSKDKLITDNIKKLKSKKIEVLDDGSYFTGKKRFVNPKYLSKGKVVKYKK